MNPIPAMTRFEIACEIDRLRRDCGVTARECSEFFLEHAPRHSLEEVLIWLRAKRARMPQDVSGYQVPPGRPRAS